MTDLEIIEMAKDGCGPLSAEEVDRLIALARAGAAVQPRPISEAPNCEFHHLWFWWPDTEEWADGALIEQIHGAPKVWYRHGHPAPALPTHFLLKSALPR